MPCGLSSGIRPWSSSDPGHESHDLGTIETRIVWDQTWSYGFGLKLCPNRGSPGLDPNSDTNGQWVLIEPQ